jgi:GDP-4-dehydro-6-deoxy-D-mannose reductase
VRALITGAAGLAGSHLVSACVETGDEVVALARGCAAPRAHDRVTWRLVDLLDAPAVASVVREAEPEIVYHLAALSSVGDAWEQPAVTLEQNTATALNVLEAVRHGAPAARLIWVSSCQVYGTAPVLPVGEDAPLAPDNPYAVSKVAAEQLARVYADAYGLELVVVRPFNHAGPGQRPIFILSSLARQAAEARVAGADTLRIATGNPDTRRDFTDVRDVVRAYRMLAASAPPETYNVSSARSVSAAEQVALVGELIAPIAVEHVIDPARVRAHEVMDLRGSHERITAVTGWEPAIPFRTTMADTIAWWESELSQAAASA